MLDTYTSNGSIDLDGNVVTYIPNSNYNGTDHFSFKVSDGELTSSAADVDLDIIKNNLSKKHSKIKEEMNKINTRLSNKSFTDKAPKDIVEQEKTNFDNLEKDAKKIELTLESL